MSRTIVLASGNAGKIREINEILADLDYRVVPQTEFGVPDADETGLSFVENAILKARNAARHTGLPAIADDSGLEVDALDGAPGVQSARYAGADATDAANVEKLLTALRDVPDAERTARFRCVMVYLRKPDDATPVIAQGTWEGRIARAPRGTNGFGYDPVFIVPDRNDTSAELPPAKKNRLSHRGQALRALAALLCGLSLADLHALVDQATQATVPVNEGDIVEVLRYDMGKSRVIMTEKGLGYESMENGKIVTWHYMVDAATSLQKVKKHENLSEDR